MFTITGKQKFGAVWYDGKCLITFNRGIATTDDSESAKILKDMGYQVEGEATVLDPFTSMTKAELEDFAKEHGIDLTKVPDKKADILDTIKAANP